MLVAVVVHKRQSWLVEQDTYADERRSAAHSDCTELTQELGVILRLQISAYLLLVEYYSLGLVPHNAHSVAVSYQEGHILPDNPLFQVGPESMEVQP